MADNQETPKEGIKRYDASMEDPFAGFISSIEDQKTGYSVFISRCF